MESLQIDFSIGHHVFDSLMLDVQCFLTAPQPLENVQNITQSGHSMVENY